MGVDLDVRVRTITLTPRRVGVLCILAGVLGLALSTQLENGYTVAYPTALLVAGLVGISITRQTATNEAPDLSIPFRAIAIVWFLLIVGLGVTIATGTARSWLGVIIIALMYGLVAVAAAAQFELEKAFALLFTTAILHRGLIYYASPVPIGNDTLLHLRFAEDIFSAGSAAPLKGLTKYYHASVFHHLTAETSVLLDVSVRDAAFLTTTLTYVIIPGLVLYAIGERILSGRAGLFAALLYLTSDFAIGWSVLVQPTSLGAIWFSVLILLLLRDHFEDRREKLLIIVILVAIAFTHQISSFIAAVTFVAAAAALSLHPNRTLHAGTAVLSMIAVSITLISYLVTDYGGPAEGQSFLTVAGAMFIERILRTLGVATGGGGGGGGGAIPAMYSTPGASSLGLSHVLAGAILFAWAVFGALVWLDRMPETPADDHSRPYLLVGIILAILLLFTFIPPIVGFRFTQPWRWFQFSYLLMAIFGGVGVVTVLQDAQWQRAGITVAVVLCLLIPQFALMGATYKGAPDDPMIDKSGEAQRFAVTDQEYQMYDHAATHQRDDPMVSDHIATVYLSRWWRANAQLLTVHHQEPAKLVNPQPHLFVQRPEMETDRVSYRVKFSENGSATRLFGHVPPEQLDVHDDNLVYSAGCEEDGCYTIQYRGDP